jgi:four helix bundle protein
MRGSFIEKQTSEDRVMKPISPLKKKSFEFAIDIVHFCKLLREKKEYELSSQLLRSGTSIGANIAEACRAQTKKDFVAKNSIAHKEAGETDFWLCLIIATKIFVSEPRALRKRLDEIVRMLCATLKTLNPRTDV